MVSKATTTHTSDLIDMRYFTGVSVSQGFFFTEVKYIFSEATSWLVGRPPGGGQSRNDTEQDRCPRVKNICFFDTDGTRVFGCGGAEEMSMSCCMCEPMETAQSLGDDTHAVAIRPNMAMRARTAQCCVVPPVGGLQAWPIDRCSNKDAGQRERETPTPCATFRQRERGRERKKESEGFSEITEVAAL